MKKFIEKNKILLILIAIMAIAVFFRLWKLDSIPPGLYPDVAINGNEALEALKSGNFKLFYPENNGREGLFINLISLSFAVFGVSIWSIKIVAAIFGILTVLGVYLLTQEVFQNGTSSSCETARYKMEQVRPARQQDTKYIALLASFFLAISFWHTNFSRIGFRVISLPFFLVFSFYFLLKGFRNKKALHFILGGIFFGLGFYTYTSFRFAVLLLPVIFIPFWLNSKREDYKNLAFGKNLVSFRNQKEFLIKTLPLARTLFLSEIKSVYFLLAVFLIALPIGIYFLKNPADFVGRAAPISIFAATNPLKEFAKSLVLHLGMFNFYGDGNWRHNFAGSPMLFWPIGILFLIGLCISLKKTLTKSNYQKENYRSLFPFYFLIFTFLIMLLPGALTKEGLPHALRVAGVIPVVYVFAGMGAWETYKMLSENTKRKKMLFLASTLFLLAMTSYEFNKYFIVWAQKKEVRDAFSSNYIEIGNYLNSLSPEIKKYVIVNQDGVAVPWPDGLPMPAQTVMFIENAKYGKIQSIYLKTSEIDEITTDSERSEEQGSEERSDEGSYNRKTEIVMLQNDAEIFVKLKTKFPDGKTKIEDDIWRFEID